MRNSSRERWKSSPAMIALQEEILRAFHEAGAMTDAGLERCDRFVRRRFAYSTLRSRRLELVERGLVCKVGATRDMNRDGRLVRMAVWGLSEAGKSFDPRALRSRDREPRGNLPLKRPLRRIGRTLSLLKAS